MKKIMRITESNINRIVKRVIRENENDSYFSNTEGDLKSEIMNLLRNDISTNEEKIRILKMIAHDMERSNKMTNDARNRFRRNIEEKKEVDELFNFRKKRKDDDHYVIVDRFRDKNNVKLKQRNGVDPYVINDRVEFTFDTSNGDRISDFRAVYHRNGKTIRTESGRFELSDKEQDRLNRKYFD